MKNSDIKDCCEFYADQLPNGCKGGRLCPARKTSEPRLELKLLVHVIFVYAVGAFVLLAYHN